MADNDERTLSIVSLLTEEEGPIAYNPAERTVKQWGEQLVAECEKMCDGDDKKGKLSYSNEGIIHRPTKNRDIPHWRFSDESDSTTAEFRISQSDVFSGGSTLKSDGVVTTIDTHASARSLRHDLVCNLLTRETDERLDAIFEPLDDNDNKTPDIIFWVNRTMIVIEVATSAGSIEALETAYKNKTVKYVGPLDARVNKIRGGTPDDKIVFITIVVGGNEVLSSVDLDPGLVNDLVQRFRTGQDIYLMLIHKLNWNIELNQSEHSAQIREIIEKEPLCNGVIDQKMMDRADKNISEFDKKAIKAHIMYKANITVHKRRTLTKKAAKLSTSYWKSRFAETETRLDSKFRERKKWTNYFMGYPDYEDDDKLPHIDERINARANTNPKQNLPDLIVKDDPMNRLWAEAFSTTSQKGFYSYSDYEKTGMALRNETYQDILKEHDKRTTCRYNLRRTDKDIIYDATYGICSKSLKNDPDVKAKRDFTKKFIKHKNPSIFNELIKDLAKEAFEKENNRLGVEELLNAADIASQNTDEDGNPLESDHAIKSFTTLKNTKIVKFLTFLSTVGVELAASGKQFCKEKSEFIVKKLARWKAWLLIKPTTVDNHIFYSILMEDPTILSESLGRDYITAEDYLGKKYIITNWSSTNTSKLNNLVTAPMSFISDVAMLSVNVKLPLEEAIKTAFVQEHSLINLFVALEDRREVEKIITNCRYAYMEAFVAPENTRIPGKILSKVKYQPRSNLEYFLIHQLIKLCEHVETYPAVPRRSVDKGGADDNGSVPGIHDPSADGSTDRFDGLISLYTGEKIVSYETALSIMYSGYFKNKHEKVNSNGLFSILKKIVKCEDTWYKARRSHMGKVSSTELREHEYNLSAVLMAADSIKDQLTASMGAQYHQAILNDWYNYLGRQTYENFATLKATCAKQEDDPKEASIHHDKNRDNVKNSKCIIEFLKLQTDMGNNACPFVTVDQIYFRARANGYKLYVFPKEQHGGEREIFVQDPNMRVLQFAIEALSKEICSKIPEEAMTHAYNKNSMFSNHSNLVQEAKLETGVSYTRRMNDDARKWSQTHDVSKFYMTIMRIIPGKHKNFIANILNMWYKREISLPANLINLMMTHKGPFESLDPEVMDIYRAFHGASEKPWLKPYANHLVLNGGMMQGILHYTSSLFHCSLQRWMYVFVHEQFDEKGIILIYSHQTSSDDTGVIATIISTSLDARAMNLLDVCLMAKWAMSELMAIYPSIEKSTPLTEHIYEFNSEFFVRTGKLRPVIKWVAASFVISESESLIDRQEQFTCARNDVLEGGGPCQLVRVINLCQGWLHYTLLGSSILTVFDNYLMLLMAFPDPHLGFYMTDPYTVSGMVPNSFNMWHLVRRHRAGLYYVEQIKTKDLSFRSNYGRAVAQIFIRYGNKMKYKSFLKKVGCEPDWKFYFNTYPEKLYSYAEDATHVRMNIHKKMHAPGVVSSLSKDGALPKVLASSIYMTTLPCMSAMAPEEGDKGRFSLMSGLVKAARIANESTDDLAKVDLLFAGSKYYKDVVNSHLMLRNLRLCDWIITRRTTTRIHLVPMSDRASLTLSEWAKITWGNKHHCYTRQFRDEEFERLQLIYTWLDMDIEVTLNRSPYEDHLSLQSFISSQSSFKRDLMINGPPLRTTDVSFETMAKRIQWPGFILQKSPIIKYSTRQAPLLVHGAAMIMALGCLKNKTEWMRKYIKGIKGDIVDGVLDEKLKIIIDHVRGTSGGTILNRIRTSKLGIIGGFVKTQKTRWVKGKLSYYGNAQWDGSIGKLMIKIYVRNNAVANITINDINLLIDAHDSLMGLIKDFGWKLEVKHSVGDVLNSKYVSRGGGHGVPILEVGDIRSMLRIEGDVELLVKPHAINLTLMGPLDTTATTILSWSPSATNIIARTDLPTDPWFTLKRGWITSWIMMYPLKTSEMASIAATIQEENLSASPEMKLARTWYYALVRARLQDIGLLDCALPYSIKQSRGFKTAKKPKREVFREMPEDPLPDKVKKVKKIKKGDDDSDSSSSDEDTTDYTGMTAAQESDARYTREKMMAADEQAVDEYIMDKEMEKLMRSETGEIFGMIVNNLGHLEKTDKATMEALRGGSQYLADPLFNSILDTARNVGFDNSDGDLMYRGNLVNRRYDLATRDVIFKASNYMKDWVESLFRTHPGLREAIREGSTNSLVLQVAASKEFDLVIALIPDLTVDGIEPIDFDEIPDSDDDDTSVSHATLQSGKLEDIKSTDFMHNCERDLLSMRNQLANMYKIQDDAGNTASLQEEIDTLLTKIDNMKELIKEMRSVTKTPNKWDIIEEQYAVSNKEEDDLYFLRSKMHGIAHDMDYTMMFDEGEDLLKIDPGTKRKDEEENSDSKPPPLESSDDD